MKLGSSLLFPNQWRLLTSPGQLSLQALIFSTLQLLLLLHYKVSSFLVSNLASMSESSDSCFSCRRHFKLLAHFLHHSKANSNTYLPGKTRGTSAGKESLGAFQKLPMVMPSIDLYSSSLRKSKRVQPTKGIANIAKRERNRGAKQLDALMKELALPLKGYMESFPRRRLLHPYERSLIELTLGDGKYEEVLGKVDALRKKVLSVGKEHASLSVLRFAIIWSRGILMGHVILNYQRFQVTDTPGLLRRCDEDRNNLEKLTLAVLTHLPTAVLYVHDLTGECGTSPSDQFGIYKEIKERFKDYLWIDVVSKCDLLRGSPVIYAKEDRSSDEAEIIKYRETGPDGSIHVSVKTEQGLSELKSRVKEVLSNEMKKIRSEARVDPSVASS